MRCERNFGVSFELSDVIVLSTKQQISTPSPVKSRTRPIPPDEGTFNRVCMEAHFVSRRFDVAMDRICGSRNGTQFTCEVPAQQLRNEGRSFAGCDGNFSI